MSLLVVNSASKVAQGLIAKLQKSGQYEKIVCADLLHNYWGVQSQVNFIGANTTGTKLVDTKLENRPDLVKAIQGASKVLYVTHDYYTNVASKTRMINHVANITKQEGKPLVAVTPQELDHYAEPYAQHTALESEKEARSANPEMTLVKSDLVFGSHSTVVSMLIQHLQNAQSIAWAPSSQGPAPIHWDCLSHTVEVLLGGEHAGKAFSAQGNNKITWNDLLSTLEKATQCHKVVNSSTLEKVASPLTNNILSESLTNDKYRNAVQFISQYVALPEQGYSNISELGVTPLDFTEYYNGKKLQKTDANDRAGNTNCMIQQFLY